MRNIKFTIGFLLLFSCLSFADNGNFTENWKYEIEITNPGTRSEGKEGILLYKQNKVGDYFETVIISGNSFNFKSRMHLWDFAGYIKDKEFSKKEKYSKTKIVNNELEKGWYTGNYNEKKKNTPDSWIWISREELKAFINPEKLEEFVTKNNLKVIFPFGLKEARE